MRSIVRPAFLILFAPLAAAQTFVYEQPMTSGGGVLRASQLWVDPSGNNDSDLDSIAWEDFELAQDQTITHIRFSGQAAPPNGFRVGFWNQDPNTVAVQPDMFGTGSHPIQLEDYTSFSQVSVGNGLFQYELDLAAPVPFAANTRYFIAVIGLTAVPSVTWGWAQSPVGQNGTFWWQRGAHMYFHLGDERAVSLAVDAPPLGTRYCGPAVPNSSGVPGLMGAAGSKVVADNDLTLLATQLPAKQFGYFLVGATQGFIANPGGSQGNLCLTGKIGRYVQHVASTGDYGSLSLLIDLTQLPSPVNHAVLPGETWNFQLWFRDKNPNQTSNFSDGYSIVFE